MNSECAKKTNIITITNNLKYLSPNGEANVPENSFKSKGAMVCPPKIWDKYCNEIEKQEKQPNP